MFASQDLAQPIELARLHKSWAAFALLCLGFLTGGFALLSAQWEPVYALRWAALTGLACAYLLAILWRGLPHNHRAGEQRLLPTLGAGNAMTLARGLLLAGLVGFLFSPWPPGLLAWIPGMLYVLIGLADILDGYLARITDHVTRLGQILDLSLDGLGVLAAALLAVQYGQVPGWYLLVALARYLFVAGTWLRARVGKPVNPLRHSVRGRAFAGVQMGFLAVILFPLFSPPGTHIAATLVAIPFLAGFLVDWLAVCGVSLPSLSGIKLPRRWLDRRLPLALRLAAILLIAWQAYQAFTAPALPGDPVMIILGDILVGVALAVGAAGRLAAIAGLVLLGFHQMAASLAPAEIALAAAYTAILFLGVGPVALWSPEDRLIYHRLGEPTQPIKISPDG
jgi:CDP-diacylglycerol--glycerol-3-phosphate 3-phosphatidyltransferase